MFGLQSASFIKKNLFSLIQANPLRSLTTDRLNWAAVDGTTKIKPLASLGIGRFSPLAYLNTGLRKDNCHELRGCKNNQQCIGMFVHGCEFDGKLSVVYHRSE